MKAGLTILVAVVAMGFVLTFWQVDFVKPAVADEGVVATATAVTMSVVGGEEEHEFVGSKKCKKCHSKWYKSWKDTPKAKTFELLKPGQGSEAKQKANLDPAKDYTKDETCLPCHATGPGKPGGYAAPDPSDEKAVKKAKALQGVGCECCHGPGSKYIELHKEIKKSKRTYTDTEMYEAGLKKIDEATCTKCHNEKSPTYVPFSYEEKKDEGSHEFFPLKQRVE